MLKHGICVDVYSRGPNKRPRLLVFEKVSTPAAYSNPPPVY